jgi:hypothetical protein
MSFVAHSECWVDAPRISGMKRRVGQAANPATARVNYEPAISPAKRMSFEGH